MARIVLNEKNIQKALLGSPTKPRKREITKTIKCEFCGKIFATSSAKEIHMRKHIQQLRREGLQPRYVYDFKTGETKIKGVKPLWE